MVSLPSMSSVVITESAGGDINTYQRPIKVGVKSI